MSLQLSPNQQLFAAQLQQDIGLNINVIDAWIRNEEPAKSSNGALGPNNWLNVGITGSSPSQWYGNQNSVWNSPISGANATAAWLKGQPIGQGDYSPTGYPGGGSTGAPILASAGQPVQTQINAIQTSGFAGGHPGAVTETAIPSLYNQAAGGVSVLPTANPNQTAQMQGNQPTTTPTGSPAGSASSTPTLQPNGYISQGGGGIFSFLGGLNPFNAIVGVWDALLGDAKYAGLFVLMLFLGGFLITKGISANGGPSPKMPKFIPVPA